MVGLFSEAVPVAPANAGSVAEQLLQKGYETLLEDTTWYALAIPVVNPLASEK